MKKLKRFIIFILIVAGSVWILNKLNLFPSLPDLWQEEQVVIDKTPILIKEIRSIGQLITYSSLDEVVVSSTLPTRGSGFVNTFNKIIPFKLLPSADKEIVLIGKGKVLAGTDLSLLADTSVQLRNDTVTVFLPKPQIFETIVNPSDFETFKESGQWNSEEVTKVKLQLRDKITERALQHNILDKAGIKSKEILQTFLTNMGYKQVYVF